ncbi:MAG: methyltransferase family protein [Candidatus Xenolissoclinum pacificiensis L6]|uniref:tRNA (guanine(46)-N(7))-methyltransferase n=1 Tax=Candidatus Xenolissoclinum pacificiensis L6 TaxID=1401685 RepID=W2V116_9RICK|nr:MAG: methyltransferase family protein [Candidatus Xenolissoclinum pacificiensis L6]
MNLLPQYLFDHCVYKCYKDYKVWLDIGCGKGDFIFSQSIYSKEHDEKYCYVGSEIYLTAISKMIRRISDNNLNDIYIFPHDIRYLLSEEYMFDIITILFPDPWHKRRHHKRRIINAQFIKSLFSHLSQQGYLIIITDNQSYYENIQLLINTENIKYNFVNKDHSIISRVFDNLNTVFYKKALFNGNKIFSIFLQNV